MQSIIHSFSANHHLFLIRLESLESIPAVSGTVAGQDPTLDVSPVHHKAHRPFTFITEGNSSLQSNQQANTKQPTQTQTKQHLDTASISYKDSAWTHPVDEEGLDEFDNLQGD